MIHGWESPPNRVGLRDGWWKKTKNRIEILCGAQCLELGGGLEPRGRACEADAFSAKSER